MPGTCHLYWRLDLTKHEVARVHTDAQALAKAIEQLVQDFADRYGIDFEEAWKGFNDVLSDLTDEASSKSISEMEELQQQIASIEAADLRRSSPVVL